MGWIDLFRSLGQSLIEVLRAELDAFKEEMSRSGRHLWMGLALAGGAATLLFWTLGALTFAVGAVLAIWLEVWAASLLVVLLFVLLTALLAWLAVRHLRRFESPARSFRRRLDDHLDWWQNTLLREEEPIEVPPSTPASGGRELS